LLEKLGLPDVASEEDAREAWQKWKEENNFHSGRSHKGSGFSKEYSCAEYKSLLS